MPPRRFSHPVCESGVIGATDSMRAKALVETISPHFDREIFMHPPQQE
jgi:hypothetical protein